MEYTVRFYKRDKFWLAFCNEIPSAMTQGETWDEARENIKDAIKLILEPVSQPELNNVEPINETVYVA